MLTSKALIVNQYQKVYFSGPESGPSFQMLSDANNYASCTLTNTLVNEGASDGIGMNSE